VSARARSSVSNRTAVARSTRRRACLTSSARVARTSASMGHAVRSRGGRLSGHGDVQPPGPARPGKGTSNCHQSEARVVVARRCSRSEAKAWVTARQAKRASTGRDHAGRLPATHRRPCAARMYFSARAAQRTGMVVGLGVRTLSRAGRTLLSDRIPL
jgi:hypothetical protein